MTDNTHSALSRRSLVLGGGSLGLMAVLAACAGPGSTGGTRSSGLDRAHKTGTVSFAHWRGEDKATFAAMVAAFRPAHPKIDVTQDITQSADYQAQALQRLRGGAIGDVFAAFRGSQFEAFVDAGLFADLASTHLADRFIPNLITSGAKGKTQYGLPYQVVLPMPIANVDILEKAGISEIPQKWDDYLGALDKVKALGITPIALPGAAAGDAGQLFNIMIANLAPSSDMCAKIESGEYKCTDKWFVQMLTQYSQLAKYVQASPGGTQSEPAEQLFASGRAAMLSTGSYHVAAVRALGAKFPIDMFPPMSNASGKPRYEGTFNSTFILGINSASKVQGAAVEWLDYLTDIETASTYANATAQFSSVSGVEYTNPDLVTLSPWLKKKTILAPRFQFIDLDLRNSVEASCIAALTGTPPEKAAEDAQHIVDQRIAAA